MLYDLWIDCGKVALDGLIRHFHPFLRFSKDSSHSPDVLTFYVLDVVSRRQHGRPGPWTCIATDPAAA